jgi:hypothetical protein
MQLPDPIDPLGLLAPEAVRIFHRALIHLLVFGFVDEAALLPLDRNLVNLVVGHHFLHAKRHFARSAARFQLSASIMRRRPDLRQGGPPATFVAKRLE